MIKQFLNEGLRTGDLENLVYPVFEVDSYRSKMGEDRDVCVLSFQVKDRHPASDLMEFIEKGYNFVLDADISSGENENGEYSVFVEIERSSKLAEQIEEILYGAKKLTGINGFKFKYHKQTDIVEATADSLKSKIPHTPRDYDGLLVRLKEEKLKNFFNRTLMDNLTLDGNVITIHKPFNQKIKLQIVEQDADTNTIFETLAAPIEFNEQATSEIFWLTKVLGNYNIQKVGDNYVFDNHGKAMVLQRI
jgi:hypothetical protein